MFAFSALKTGIVFCPPQTFSYWTNSTTENGYAWSTIYDERTPSNGLGSDVFTRNINGYDGQEDEVIQSAFTAARTEGKDVVERKERFSWRIAVVVVEFEAAPQRSRN